MADKKSKRGQGEWSFVERTGRKGQWVARKQFGKKENGKPNIVCLYGKSKTEVKNKATEYESRLLTNQQFNVSKETVYGYVKKWLETIKRHSVKATTYVLYNVSHILYIIRYTKSGEKQFFSAEIKALNNIRQ